MKKNETAPGRAHSELHTVYMEIVRRRRGETVSRRQTFRYEMRDAADTVATALKDLETRTDLRDAEGEPAEPVIWECSCLQRKCGACAMVINGRPALACDSPLRLLPEKIVLEPLRKFPVVADLQTDRGIMQKNLREMRLWMEREAVLNEKKAEDVYEASRCLQCGLCLEVCPNFDPEGGFTGAAAAVPAARVLTASPDAGKGRLPEEYRKRVFEGCGKSLACRDICPAGIDTGEMLAQSNALAVWKRKRKSRKK